MVEVDKQELNEAKDSNQTNPETEGGDVVNPTPETPPKEDTPVEEKPQSVDPVAEMDIEEQEYSDEEFKRYVDLYDRTMTDIEQGQIVMGRVLAVTDNEVLVDIGFKSEGSIPIDEFGEPPEVKVGDKVEVFLDDIEDADGQLILSKKKATFMRLWDKVVDVHNQGGTIEGRCMRRIKGGIVVDLMGVDAFLPGSQIDVKPIRDFDALIGQVYEFKIVKVNRLRKNIVVSRRALLEESMAEQREEVLDTLEKGQIREGMVKNITDFGVFVDLGGVDGLLHINDLSWGRVKHPSEVVKLDEKIKVVVLDFNDAKDRISLGLKQLQPHPWKEIDQKYPEGAVVKGKVVSIADYGAFVELERGVEGLVHVSEMSWTRHGVHPSKMVSVGEMIDVKILSVDKDRKRISLGIKQLYPDPWEEIDKKFPVGTKYKGRVRNMTNFGAFVEMEEGIDGLIHISDLSWTKKIKHPSEVLKKGEEVEVIVLEVNKDDRRVSLGFKQLTEDPWPAFEEAYKVDSVTKAKVIRFVDKGVIVELPLGLEGFVPLSQMPEPSIAKVQQNLKVDDELELQVIEFDRNNKRIVLSRKRLLDEGKDKGDSGEVDDVKAYMQKGDEAPTLGEMAGQEAEEKPEKAEKKGKEQKKAADSETSSGDEPVQEDKPTSEAESDVGEESDEKTEEVSEPPDVPKTDEVGEESKEDAIALNEDKPAEESTPPAEEVSESTADESVESMESDNKQDKDKDDDSKDEASLEEDSSEEEAPEKDAKKE